MICPHCKNEVSDTSYICSVCGANFQENPVKQELTYDQKYIYKKLSELGIYKYRNKENIFEEELSKEDEFFLRLKIMDMLQKNNEIMRKQEEHLYKIKNILIFFTVVAIVAGVLSFFYWHKYVRQSIKLFIFVFL